MTFARIRLVVTAVLFMGWLGWLGYAVYVARWTDKPPVLSRAQLTAATHLLVAEITVGGDGLPNSTVTIVEVLRGEGIAAGATTEVLNLPAAMPPGSAGFPGPGKYLIPAVGDGKTFRVAGLPRTPGYEPSTPARPAVYHWDDRTQAQLHGLGLLR